MLNEPAPCTKCFMTDDNIEQEYKSLMMMIGLFTDCE